MLFTAYQLPLKMKANMAAAYTNCTAVAPAESSAAFVLFQRRRASSPPAQNVNSAVFPLCPADNSAGILQFVQ